MMARRRAALAVLLLLASAAPCVRGQGAQPAGGAAAACADLPPSPPTGLVAKAGDGVIELQWGPPTNKACVTSYQVTVLPVDPAARAAPLPPRMATDAGARNATIRGLANGVQVKVFVRAVGGAKYGGAGGEAQVAATPSRAADLGCLPNVLPSPPTNVSAVPGNASITLRWSAPVNGACVSEFRVAVRPQGSSAAPRYLSAPATASSLTIGQLPPAELMSISLQAYSATLRGGQHTTVLAAALARPRQWTCTAVPSFYPLCGAAAAGFCTPFSCKEQAAAGERREGRGRGRPLKGWVLCCLTPSRCPHSLPC